MKSANSVVWWIAGSLLLLAVSANTIYELGYRQGRFDVGTVACWPTDDDPTPMETHP